MKIVVLAGGISTERDVSLISGTQIYRALQAKGHQVVLLDLFLGLSRRPVTFRIFLTGTGTGRLTLAALQRKTRIFPRSKP